MPAILMPPRVVCRRAVSDPSTTTMSYRIRPSDVLVLSGKLHEAAYGVRLRLTEDVCVRKRSGVR